MDPDGDPPKLAPAYQLALDLEAAGLEGADLAERLGVPAESLRSLLSVAHAKATSRTTRPTTTKNA